MCIQLSSMQLGRAVCDWGGGVTLGVCVTRGCDQGCVCVCVCVCDWRVYTPRTHTPYYGQQMAVCILLECFLVTFSCY